MTIRRPVYLDYNATTPHDPEIIEAMKPFLTDYFGNPSSAHWYGAQTKMAVENARCQLASLLGCLPNEVVFTSGGTEANNFAIKGTAFRHRDRGNHIITSQIEHPAVIEVCKFLEEQDFKVSYLPVDRFGRIKVSDVEKVITPKTILITIMHANNEVGTIQPIEEISGLARRYGIIFHTDAAQSLGKIPVNVNKLGVDLLSVAGHKLYAPKGVGALYIRQGVSIDKLLHGAGHESGRRPGTENVLEIVGLGQACEIASRDLDKVSQHMRQMRDRLVSGLERTTSDVRLNGHPHQRLPNTANISFKHINAASLIARISDEVAVSAGSACHSCSEVTISPVLEAMNIPRDWVTGTIRFSVGKFTTPIEIDHAVQSVSDAVARIRKAGLLA
ncbi:MAG: cysteine desulfurase family protein [Desulfomonilaceae bacterium]